MKEVEVKIRQKEDCTDLPLPAYQSEGSSGMDLYADVAEDTNLEPGQIKLISTGIYISLPLGYEAEIRPRSGLALKHGLSLVNSPGTIDSDYRGLISLIMINLGPEPYKIKRAERVAQMVIKSVTHAKWIKVDSLDQTQRNEGGFGHTGV